MMHYVAYNTALGNALVGVSCTPFENLPDGMFMETFEGDIPDLARYTWNGSSLTFDLSSDNRYHTPTEFMRRFTQAERLAIRQLERDGDLVVIDAMALMQGTVDGVNLDDPDVLSTLQYLAHVKGVLAVERIAEILS